MRFLAALAVISPVAALAQTTDADQAMPTIPSLYQHPLPEFGDPATKTFDNGSVMYADIIYSAIIGYRPMTLDLYLPEGAQSADGLPLVMWYHGGGYRMGNPRSDWTYGDWTEVLARLTGRGFAVAAVEYRLQQEAPFPAQLEDGAAAIRFMHDNAQRWNIDTDRTYVWGLSAGAHLASMLGVGRAGGGVQGVAEWFGPSDLIARGEDPARARRYADLLACDGGCSDEILTTASPALLVDSSSPPFFIAHGTEDKIVPIKQADILVAALQAAKVPVIYYRLDGMRHGFEGGTSEQQEQILLDTFAFFDHLAEQ